MVFSKAIAKLLFIANNVPSDLLPPAIPLTSQASLTGYNRQYVNNGETMELDCKGDWLYDAVFKT